MLVAESGGPTMFARIGIMNHGEPDPAIVLSIGAVHLIDNYLGPIDQAEAHYSAAGSD